MELLDPRLGLIAAGAAVMGSERVRKIVGRGVGYGVAGAMAVGGPVVRPLAQAGRDVVGEARQVAGRNGTGQTARPRAKAAAR